MITKTFTCGRKSVIHWWYKQMSAIICERHKLIGIQVVKWVT